MDLKEPCQNSQFEKTFDFFISCFIYIFIFIFKKTWNYENFNEFNNKYKSHYIVYVISSIVIFFYDIFFQVYAIRIGRNTHHVTQLLEFVTKL